MKSFKMLSEPAFPFLVAPRSRAFRMYAFIQQIQLSTIQRPGIGASLVAQW